MTHIDPSMAKLVEASKKLQKIMVQECKSKHTCDPREDDLNPDYNVTLTLSFGEMRDFIKVLREASTPLKEFPAKKGMDREQWLALVDHLEVHRLFKDAAACRQIAESLE